MTIIWPGTPGESFSNDTDKILYQLICTWSNTCGICGQYHLAIAKWWPKFHHGCNCISRPVPPGERSKPYEDWREIVKDLEPDQQAKLVGKSNYRLIEEGVVKWEDVVTSSRVRSLQEVVSRGSLTVDQLVDAGVRRDIAERAWGAVNTPEHLIVAQQRADLVRRIQELGVQPKHLAEMFGEEMARRIGIGAGPSGAGVMPPTSNYRSLDDWVRLIVAGGIPGDLGARLEQARKLAETPTPKPGPAIDPIKARIDGWTEGDDLVRRIAELADKLDFDKRFERWRQAEDALDKYTFSLKAGDRRKKAVRERLKELNEEYNDAKEWAFRGQARMQREIGELLKAKAPISHLYTDQTPDAAARLKGTIKEGMDWLMPLIEEGSSWGIQIQADSPSGLNRDNAGGTQMHLSLTTEVRTVIHEIGHLLEDQLKGVSQLGRDFLKYRAKGQQWKNLKQKFPDYNYDDGERGIDDDFGKFFSKEGSAAYFGDTSSWYVGKEYPDRSEIISMGLEALYVNGGLFAQKDPEYAKLIIGVLTGKIR